MKIRTMLIRQSLIVALMSLTFIAMFSSCGLLKYKWDVKVQNMTINPATFVWGGTSYTIESLQIKTISDVKEGTYSWEAEWTTGEGIGYSQEGEATVEGDDLSIKIYDTGVTTG